MRNYDEETRARVSWIAGQLSESKTKGIVFGNSGGKDSALVGILCKMATENVLGVVMPCESAQNYSSDKHHAELLAQQFNIETSLADLTSAKRALMAELEKVSPPSTIEGLASNNINPRLRMTTLYALAQSRGYLVAGTGNQSEYFTGYFTKWGDGAYDINPIADLLAGEVLDFLKHLGAPEEIIGKPPSAGLYEGQTDETDMGVSYNTIDKFISTAEATPKDKEIIMKMHNNTAHKRRPPLMYDGRITNPITRAIQSI